MTENGARLNTVKLGDYLDSYVATFIRINALCDNYRANQEAIDNAKKILEQRKHAVDAKHIGTIFLLLVAVFCIPVALLAALHIHIVWLNLVLLFGLPIVLSAIIWIVYRMHFIPIYVAEFEKAIKPLENNQKSTADYLQIQHENLQQLTLGMDQRCINSLAAYILQSTFRDSALSDEEEFSCVADLCNNYLSTLDEAKEKISESPEAAEFVKSFDAAEKMAMEDIRLMESLAKD